MTISRRLTLVAAVVAFASADALATSVIGTWEHSDERISISVRLVDDGTCRITATSPLTGVDSLCSYVVRGDVVVIHWEGQLWVYRSRPPEPLRLYRDPDYDLLEIDGLPRLGLTRRGVAKA